VFASQQSTLLRRPTQTSFRKWPCRRCARTNQIRGRSDRQLEVRRSASYYYFLTRGNPQWLNGRHQ